MKHRILLVLAAAVFCLGATAQKQKTLTILHTNDTHSCIVPFNPQSADTATANKGGYLRRAAFLRDMRRQDKRLLLFDCGDFSQGSPYYNMFEGEVEIKLMNAMHYDAATIGNHEFDFGLENMARLFRMAKFPIVCANYGFAGTPVQGLVRPYTVIRRKGLKIGVFGVSPKMEGLVQAKNFVGATYEDPVVAANRTAAILRHELHCDVVICLSHLGWNIGGDDDNRLIAGTRNIDLVLGGHSHTYFTVPRYVKNLDGADIPDYQMGKNGRFVGVVELLLAKTPVPSNKTMRNEK